MKKHPIIIVGAIIAVAGGAAGGAWYRSTVRPTPITAIVASIKQVATTVVPTAVAAKTVDTSRAQTAPVTTTRPAATPAPLPAPVASTTPTEIITSDGTHYPLRHYQTLGYNDPRATQWWTTTTGLQTLWNIPVTSGYTPTIAVIDTGFALNHEELAGRWATNAADPIDGIDNDGDGYVDDWRGWDFAYNDNNPQAGVHNPNGSGTTHGTMTAGTAAATAGNGVGIAGVSQTAKILPVQVMDDDSNGTSYTVGQGVIYAAQRHADIISISLGTTGDDPYLRSAIDYAIGQGSVVVASAGNTSCDCLAYPAAYPEVVAVGSVSQAGTLSSFSSYGANLDLLAPGENMTLPAWSAAYPTNGYMSGAAGTSFSAPLVSGALASLKALSPTSTGAELVAALKETADHKTLTPASPHSSTLGFGVVNVGAAATRLTTAATPAIRYSLGPTLTGTTLESSRVYSCQDAAFPSAELFEIADPTTKAGLSYTISDLDVLNATNAGQSVRSLGYQCVGQAVDRPTTLRSIDLSHEIH